jgi:hypothetical protein
MFDALMTEIQKMEAEREGAKRELEQLGKPTNAEAGQDTLIANVRRLPEAIQSADSDLIHDLLRESIERVDLNFQVITMPKNKRFICEEGSVRLRSSHLSTNGQGPG